jgi:signal transduction histidine kinase
MEIALSAVEECIVWTNSRGQIKWCNASFERLLGQSRLFILGALLSDKLPLQLDNQLVNDHPVEIALRTQEGGKRDYEFQQSGQALLLEVAWAFVKLGNNLGTEDDAASAVLVLRNVTQQRQAERRQQEINELLEQQVAQRTQELSQVNAQLQNETIQLQQLLTELKATQAHLIQVEKMSSLGQLVAGIAHEVNNPINFIHANLTHVQDYADNLLNFVQICQRYHPQPVPEINSVAKEIDLEFLQGDLPKLLKSMKVGTERIRNIVLSLRNFSRMDEAEFKTINIHDGIDSTLLILQHRLRAESRRSDIEVMRDFGDLPLIECYPGELNQVFMNILVNAIDAIEESYAERMHCENQRYVGRITICTSVIDSQWVKIAIADNGMGMSAQVQQKIFNPFFTTKPIGTGTGMGMAISYRIVVERHGGKLDCFSEIGKGTEFVIQIPMSHSIPASTC